MIKQNELDTKKDLADEYALTNSTENDRIWHNQKTGLGEKIFFLKIKLTIKDSDQQDGCRLQSSWILAAPLNPNMVNVRPKIT